MTQPGQKNTERIHPSMPWTKEVLHRIAGDRMTVRLEDGRVFRGKLWVGPDATLCVMGMDSDKQTVPFHPKRLVMVDLEAPDRCPSTGRRAVDL